MEGQFALFWMPAVGVEGYTPAQGRLPSQPNRQQVQRFRDRGRGLRGETARSALTVILNLVIGGWTSSILIVLGTVTLQSQGQFVPVSLRPFLRTGAAVVMAIFRSSASCSLAGGGNVHLHTLSEYCL